MQQAFNIEMIESGEFAPTLSSLGDRNRSLRGRVWSVLFQ